MQAERNRVIAVIKDFTEGLKAQKENGPATGNQEQRVREVLRQACERVGVAPDEYAEALSADAVLAKLEHDAIVQALAGSADPGPHDAISRESPSGRDADLTKVRGS